jgi:hypothetical protein
MPSTQIDLYKRSKKTDLVTFTTNRGIPVQSTAKSSNEPLRKDYLRALKEADADRTFDFLGLPPELRNRIYRELLVLRDSFTCQPQIVRVCKQINGEASSILYGDNLIEVKVFNDGVFAHGKKCGNYDTDYSPGYQTQRNKGRNIIWPQFVRRAQFVRLSIVSYQHPSALARGLVPRLGALHYILYSVCLFLNHHHRLRSLVLDLTVLRSAFKNHGAMWQFEDELGTALFPLRLLLPIRDMRIEGSAIDLTSMLTPPKQTIDVAEEIISGSTWSLLRHNQLVTSTSFLICTGGSCEYLMKSLAWVLSCSDFLLESSDGSRGMLQSFLTIMQVLRGTWDQEAVELLTGQCKKQIAELVRLDVEVKLMMNRKAQVGTFRGEES